MKVLTFWAFICLNFVLYSQSLDTATNLNDSRFANQNALAGQVDSALNSSSNLTWHFEKLGRSTEKLVAVLPGEELLLIRKGETGLPVRNLYFNNREVGRLTDLKGGYYSVTLPVEIDGEKLSDHFRSGDEHQVPIKVYVGQSLSIREQIFNKETADGTFLLIIDEHRKMRIWFSVVGIILILLFLLIAITKAGIDFLRDDVGKKDMPVDFKAPFSLSRTQFAFWTVVVLFCFFYVWILKGSTIEISGNVLALLGISAGTALGGKLLDQKDLRDPQIKHRHQEENDSRSLLLNIISDERGISIHRFQNVVFSIAIACYFLFSVVNEKQFPELDGGLMTLMGISSGTYLTLKSKENTPTNSPPVG